MGERQYNISGRRPPFREDAEQAVLGSILLNNKALSIVLRYISADDFYVEANRIIFSAMSDVVAQGKPVDTVTVGTHLIDTGELGKIGGSEVFNGFTDKVATVSNVEHYAKIVKEMSARRAMIYAAQEIVSKGFETEEETPVYLSESRKIITEKSNSLIVASGPERIGPTVEKVFKEILNKTQPEGLIKTGIAPIDNSTGGIWPGELTTVAARPGMGKSAFALNVIANVALLQGKKALVFSLEESREQIVTRLLARFSDIDVSDLRLRDVETKEEWSRLTEAASFLSREHNLWVEQATGLSSAQITQMIAYHKEVHGVDLVMLDHLSEIREIGENETVRMTNAARGARDCCKDLGLPFMLLAQLNRELEKRPNKRPLLSDLRQSGEIEQLSRSVWFLYRGGYYDPDGERRRDLELLVPKANNGKTGTLRLFADMSRMFITGWNVTEHGIWPEDDHHTGEIEARDRSRERSRENRQQNFFGGDTDDGRDY